MAAGPTIGDYRRAADQRDSQDREGISERAGPVSRSTMTNVRCVAAKGLDHIRLTETATAGFSSSGLTIPEVRRSR